MVELKCKFQGNLSTVLGISFNGINLQLLLLLLLLVVSIKRDPRTTRSGGGITQISTLQNTDF